MRPSAIRGPVALVVEQDPLGGTVKIVELAATHRPQESGQAEQAEKQGDRDQVEQPFHRLQPPRRQPRRAEFNTTKIELVDIDSAATKGVTKPSTASGTARRL
jgi:hypothetical protein